MPKWYQREGQPCKTENELTNVGEDGAKPNPNANPNPKKKETNERNLEKGKKKVEPSGFKLSNSKTNHSVYDNPTNCARWQFVANYIISLRFIAQHVINKKLVLSLTWLTFPLVRFRHNPVSVVGDYEFKMAARNHEFVSLLSF